MTLELAFTPGGQVTAVPSDRAPGAGGGGPVSGSEPTGPGGKILQAFAASPAEGLFALAADRCDAAWGPSAAYWRDFAGRYLTELCQTPEGSEPELAAISPPDSAELGSMLVNLPPMPGAEYVTAAGLERVWRDLDAWVRQQIAATGQGRSGFLRARAPLWHQVGRVCFHLAENRRDPDYPFAFLATYAPTLARTGAVRYQPLNQALQQYAGTRNKQGLVKLLAPVQKASEASALVRELVESGDIFQPLAWPPAQAYRFLKDVPVLEQSGVLVRLPDWWKRRARPRVTVTIGDRRQARLSTDSLLDFRVRLALGDQELSEQEWRDLLTREDGLVLLRGQWVELDRQKLGEALRQWKAIESRATDGISFIDGMRLLAGAPRDLGEESEAERSYQEWCFVDAGKWLGQTLANLRNPGQAAPVWPDCGLQASLRPYQGTGVGWLWLMSNLGLGACLADDMGLGKTLQILALLLRLKTETGSQPSLLVLPASLLANWRSEMARFTPTLRARFVHPSQTPGEELARMAGDPGRALRNVDVVLTSYGMLPRQPWLLEVRWRLVVLDEAQAIKNPGAKQTRTVKRLQGASRIALTGTPVENRLSDLWSIFDFLCPGLLGSSQRFKQFVRSLENRPSDRYAPLRRLVQPYILRRLKTDKQVIADLPEKTEVHAYCGLTKQQAALYAGLVRELTAALPRTDGMKRRGLVLTYLMRFKQVCNHPSQLLGDGEFAPEASGKFSRLAQLGEEIASRQEKALVFTQFREMAEPLSAFLSVVFGRPGLVLHGGTPVGQRQQRVDAFQRDNGPPFFVLSLKAGGTGLNLTAGSHVIHFDRWWNPAVENQATDRAFRIGQKRNVLVHKFVCPGTVEDKIDVLIEEKIQLVKDVLPGGAESMLTELSDKELIELVSLDIDRASL